MSFLSLIYASDELAGRTIKNVELPESDNTSLLIHFEDEGPSLRLDAKSSFVAPFLVAELQDPPKGLNG